MPRLSPTRGWLGSGWFASLHFVRQLELSFERSVPVARSGTGVVVGGWSDTERVQYMLRALIGPKVLVRLTSNRSTMLSYEWRRGVLYLRLHRAFAEAQLPVLKAVAAFTGVGRYTKARARIIDRFIDAASPRRQPCDRGPIRSQGQVHDLKTTLEDLNRSFFDGRIEAEITWAVRRARRGGRKRTIRLGTYVDDLKLIRVHPALDQVFVPEFYLRSVVFHEMLHQVFGIERSPSGRRIIHSAAFRRAERAFPDHERAQEWEHRNLARLLQSA